MRDFLLILFALIGLPALPAPIHVAAEKGDLVAMKELLQIPEALEAPDEHGLTPLMLAAGGGHRDVVALLLQNGARITSCQWGTALHWAAGSGDVGVVDLLLDKGGDVNAVNEGGETPIIKAIETGSLAMVRHLIEHGASVNPVGPTGHAPLDRALSMPDNDEMVETLLLKGATSRNPAPSLLDLYVERDDQKGVEKLLEAGANVNPDGGSGDVPLCHARSLEMMSLLLAHGADVNARSWHGQPALSCHLTEPDAVAFLLEHGAIPDIADEDGTTPLLAACREAGQPYLRVAEMLLDKGADPNHRSRGESTPLLAAVMTVNKPMAELLIRHGADVNGGKGPRWTPLHAAANQGLEETDTAAERQAAVSVLRLLVEKGADVNARDTLGQTPLFRAVHATSPAYALYLLKHGANLRATDKQGRTVLHEAVSKGNRKAVDLLLQRGLSVNTRSMDGRTPLYEAVKSGSLDVYHNLIRKGANPRAKTATGRTLLFEAVRYGRTEIAADLIRRGLDVNARNAAGVTALHVAAYPGPNSLAVLSLLLGHGAKVNVQMKDGRTPMDVVGTMDALKLLRKAGAKPRGGWLVVGDDPPPLPE